MAKEKIRALYCIAKIRKDRNRADATTLQIDNTKLRNLNFPEKERHGHSPISYINVFVCDLYIPRIGPHISCSRTGRSIVRIYKSHTDTLMWKLKLWPRYSFSENICFQFSVLVLCSADDKKEKIQCLITVEAEVKKEKEKEDYYCITRCTVSFSCPGTSGAS